MTIKFTRRSVCALGAAALGCAAFPPFAAEDPIRIIVPYPPGGPLDVTARAVAEEARHDLGNIIVENKPGAGGNIGLRCKTSSGRQDHRHGRSGNTCRKPQPFQQTAV